jgi:hypothetical protein
MAPDQVRPILGELLPGRGHLDQLIALLALHALRQRAAFLGVLAIL